MTESDKVVYKLALMGDSSVGKTTIFKKIASGKFSETNISTIGTDKKTLNYHNIEVDDKGTMVKKSFEISLFDTAGQERFRSISKSFIKGSDGIILIYDVTNKNSYEHIELWIQSIKEVLSDWRTSDYLLMILGNKLDLVNSYEKEREVQAEDAKQKCEEQDIFWGGECSAKDFSDEDFKKLFESFVKKIFAKIGKKTQVVQKIKKVGKYKKKKKCGIF